MTDSNTQNNQQQTGEAASPEAILSELTNFSDIKLELKVLLGKIKMPIGQYLKISRGSIVELNKARTDFLDVIVNGQKIAEGEVVLSNESDNIAIEVTKTHKPKKF